MEKLNKTQTKHKVWAITAVRFLPFIVFAHIYYVTHYSYEGYIVENSEFILGNSMIYALTLLLISLMDERYHCIWNRAMWIELVFIPFFCYIDSKWLDVDDWLFMVIINTSMDITMLATAILAINHFIVPRIRNKLNN